MLTPTEAEEQRARVSFSTTRSSNSSFTQAASSYHTIQLCFFICPSFRITTPAFQYSLASQKIHSSLIEAKFALWPNVSPSAPHTRVLKRPDILTPSSIHHRCLRQTLALRRSVVQIVWLRGLVRHENRRFLPQKSVFSVRPRCHRAASGQPP